MQVSFIFVTTLVPKFSYSIAIVAEHMFDLFLKTFPWIPSKFTSGRPVLESGKTPDNS